MAGQVRGTPYFMYLLTTYLRVQLEHCTLSCALSKAGNFVILRLGSLNYRVPCYSVRGDLTTLLCRQNMSRPL